MEDRFRKIEAPVQVIAAGRTDIPIAARVYHNSERRKNGILPFAKSLV
jgi:hypothetical protein